MTNTIEEYDVIALRKDLPELKLKKGEEGTVVLILAPNVFEVEFCDADGITYAMGSIKGENLSVVWKAEK